MTVLRLLLGSLAALVAAAVTSAVVGLLLIGAGAPVDTVVLLALAVMLLVSWGGALLVARRWPPEEPIELVAASASGPALGIWMLLGSQSPLWFRLLALVALAGAGVGGAWQGARRSTSDLGYAHPAGLRGERGSGSLEFVGVVILAAVLVAAAVGATASSSPAARDKIWATICTITGGECDPANAPSNADYKPEDCEIYSAEQRLEATVDVAIARVGGSMVLQRSEKSNGDIDLTVVDEGRLGVAGGVGGHGKVTIGKKKIGVDYEAEAAATGGLQAGDTYVFDNRNDADEFQSYLRREFAEDAFMGDLTPAGLVNKGIEWLTDEKPPSDMKPQKTFVRVDEQVSVEAAGSLGFGTGAGIELEGMQALGVEHDRGKNLEDTADDKQTTYFQVDWNAVGNVGLMAVKGMDAAASGSGILKVTTSNDGRGDEVQIISKGSKGFEIGLAADDGSTSPAGKENGPNAKGGTPGLESFGLDFKGGTGGSTVVTQTLKLDTPQRNQAFSDWLLSGGATNLGATAAASSGWADSEKGENVTSFGDGAEGFSDLMTREAKVSVVQYDNDTWGLGGGAGISAALKVALDAGYEDSEAEATKAAYLGAPDAEGNRTAYELPECVS